MNCAPNIDFNAGVIDCWSRQTYKERQKRLKNSKEYQETMKPIRRTHVCYKCRKYPGDEEYMFGTWGKDGQYCCFDCY